MNTSGRYHMPPHNSSAKASPTGRYQVGAPAHAWEAADDLSRSKNVTKKIAAKINCLYQGACLQFRGSREVPSGHDGAAGLFELGIIRAPFIVESGTRRFSRDHQSRGFPLCLSAAEALGFNSVSPIEPMHHAYRKSRLEFERIDGILDAQLPEC
jgi:hypothetical protein